MVFQPGSGSHAVASARFVIRYASALPPERVSRTAFPESASWKADLPGEREVQGILVPIGMEGVSPVGLHGTEFLLFQPDGTPAWLLRFARDHLAVECRLYTRWKPVWHLAKRYFEAAIEFLRQDAPPEIARFEVQIVDRFRTTDRNYDAAEVLAKSTVLPNDSFARGSAWHCHTGWFEESGEGRTLHNANFDSTAHPQVDRLEDATAWQIQVLHMQRLDLPHSKTLVDTALIESFAQTMHEANKQFLRNALAPKMQELIGLNKVDES